jgi:hypothetical protein
MGGLGAGGEGEGESGGVGWWGTGGGEVGGGWWRLVVEVFLKCGGCWG